MSFKQTVQSTGRLKEEHHSSYSARKSEHYHARVLEPKKPSNQTGLNAVKTRDEYGSPRPGLTAQRGLGG